MLTDAVVYRGADDNRGHASGAGLTDIINSSLTVKPGRTRLTVIPHQLQPRPTHV